MPADTLEQIDSVILKIQRLLGKIDRLRLPMASHRDVESILVRQITGELERALPWQAGHATRTAFIACRIRLELGLDFAALHQLRLAALLHNIGLLMLPDHLRSGGGMLDPDSYVAIQKHSRIGASLLEPFTFLREAAVLTPIITNGGMDQDIHMAFGVSSFRLVPEFCPLLTRSNRSKSPMCRIVPYAIVSRSRFSVWHLGLNSILAS